MNPLLVNVAELLRRPGTARQLVVGLTAEELGVVDARVLGDDEITVSVKLESLSDGVVVTGAIRSPWHDHCKRCLAPTAGEITAPVDELYSHRQPEVAFPIVGDQIDLTSMARELVVLELPLAPLCRIECAGICPVCGTNRNDETCQCDTPVTDDRWAALDVLRQQLN